MPAPRRAQLRDRSRVPRAMRATLRAHARPGRRGRTPPSFRWTGCRWEEISAARDPRRHPSTPRSIPHYLIAIENVVTDRLARVGLARVEVHYAKSRNAPMSDRRSKRIRSSSRSCPGNVAIVRSPPLSEKTAATPSLASMTPFRNTTSRACTRTRRMTRCSSIAPLAFSFFATSTVERWYHDHRVIRENHATMNPRNELDDWLTELPPLDGDEDDEPGAQDLVTDDLETDDGKPTSLDDASADDLEVDDDVDITEESSVSEDDDRWEADVGEAELDLCGDEGDRKSVV